MPATAVRAALLTILVAALLAAQAHAAFGPPTQVARKDGEFVVAAAFSKTSRGALVVQRGFPPYDVGRTALVTLPSGRRTDLGPGAVIAQAARADGGVDLLVRRGSKPYGRADLILRRVLPSGHAFDLWSVRTDAERAAIVRDNRRTIVVWPAGSTLRIVSRPDGGIPTPQRVARLRLTSVSDLDAVVDRDGRLVVAVSGSRDGLVLASVSVRGRVLHRQRAPGVDGLVTMRTDHDGRVAALILDTGIEGDEGECVQDGRGRQVRAVLRAADAQLFEPVQTIASPPLNCLGGTAMLTTVGGRFFAVLFQAAGESSAGLVRQAVAGPGSTTFLPPADVAADADLAGAVPTATGVLMALRARPAAAQGPAALSVLTHPSRVRQEIAATGAQPSWPLLVVDAASRPALVWSESGSLKIARDDGAG